MTCHNLRHKARIIALGALLLLVQACGGGSSTLTEADCAANEEFMSVSQTRGLSITTVMMCRDRVATDCAANEEFVSSTMTCRDRVATDCSGTTPVLGSDGVCRARGAGG